MEAASRLHFGALLRQFRLDAGMTQQQLAERSKLSVEAIGALERGARTRPYKETVALLARALELTPEREALMESASDVARPPRRQGRMDAVPQALLRIVRPDTQTTRGHNLPRQVTSFVGRNRETAEIVELLRAHRLVTVVGPGGVGKTRIALQTGRELLDGCPDGVWLVDLAPLSDQTLVPSAVLSALHVPTSGSALDAVVAYLKTRRLLLVLDNCEHVIARARDVAASIMQSCSNVRVLSTSREALGIAVEQAYHLPPLSVPPQSLQSARDVAPYGAVALFVDRAFAVNAAFALTDNNAPDVVEICGRLDGIPLAIELAAARVNVLAPHQIAHRLDQRFRLLTAEDAYAEARHQTMGALFDWSYDLLTPREQSLFDSLSVFADGCTVGAVTAVCATDGEDDIDIIKLIVSLVRKSLVIAELVGNEQRYRLLESSRQYGREKLMARGSQEQTVRRHALAYLELAEQFEREAINAPDSAWLPRALAELENWRAALEWALEKRGDVIIGQRLAAARKLGWVLPAAEMQRWVRAASELVDHGTPVPVVAQLQLAKATFAHQLAQRNVCLEAAEHALTLYRRLGSERGTALSQSLAGGSLAAFGRYSEAEPLLQEALEAARRLGDRRLAADVLHKMGVALLAVGDFEGARGQLTESLRLAKLAGAEFFANAVQTMLAQNEFEAGDPETALRLMAEVLAIHRTMTYPLAVPSMATGLFNTAGFLLNLRRYDEAAVHASEALELARGLQLSVLVAFCLRTLALVALLKLRPGARRASGENARIARLFGFADARLNALGASTMRHGLQEEYDRAIGGLRDELSADELARLTAAGARMTEDEAVDEVNAIQ
jgi:predicted ATPase/transcriptional regulator with XRE-family HTH domain